jgi:hypothetical protein
MRNLAENTKAVTRKTTKVWSKEANARVTSEKADQALDGARRFTEGNSIA